MKTANISYRFIRKECLKDYISSYWRISYFVYWETIAMPWIWPFRALWQGDGRTMEHANVWFLKDCLVHTRTTLNRLSFPVRVIVVKKLEQRLQNTSTHLQYMDRRSIFIVIRVLLPRDRNIHLRSTTLMSTQMYCDVRPRGTALFWEEHRSVKVHTNCIAQCFWYVVRFTFDMCKQCKQVYTNVRWWI